MTAAAQTLPDTSGWPSPTGLFKYYDFYFKRGPRPPEKALRRGRLSDHGINLLATGYDLDPEWEAKHDIGCECCGGVTPYIAAARLFLDEHEVEVVRHQVEVVNETERYRGRFDWDAVIDGQEAYVDVKTTSGGSIPDFTGIQIALYALADGNRRKRRYGLALAGNGRYHLVPFTDPKDFDRGILLCRAWWVAQRYRSDNGTT